MDFLNIRMAGIDHNQASVEVRELFAMTKTAAKAEMQQICANFHADGCVIISTCNRTELWVSGESVSPGKLLCEMKGVDEGKFRDYLVEREGSAAVRHLFELSCGMKSQVFGEDQIITQVKDAIALAREAESAGAVLEILFRTAITAAKRVKASVRLTVSDQSVAGSTVAFLRERLGSLKGIPCMVIGNGEMGRLAAAALVNEGCEVRMTIRQYRHGEVVIPEGVEAIPYDRRMETLHSVRAVISATISPHYTLCSDKIGALANQVIFCDLAVPRDIDPAIAKLENAQLYDTDQICAGTGSRIDKHTVAQAEEILKEYISEFESWCRFRTLVPVVNEISEIAADDCMGRIEKSIRRLELPPDEQERLTEQIHAAAGRVVGRLMYGLRENLEPELWESCMEGLKKSAERGLER